MYCNFQETMAISAIQTRMAMAIPLQQKKLKFFEILRGAAITEYYFCWHTYMELFQQKEQIAKLKTDLTDEISFHEEQIKRHQEAIARHKNRVSELDKKE